MDYEIKVNKNLNFGELSFIKYYIKKDDVDKLKILFDNKKIKLSNNLKQILFHYSYKFKSKKCFDYFNTLLTTNNIDIDYIFNSKNDLNFIKYISKFFNKFKFKTILLIILKNNPNNNDLFNFIMDKYKNNNKFLIKILINKIKYTDVKNNNLFKFKKMLENNLKKIIKQSINKDNLFKNFKDNLGIKVTKDYFLDNFDNLNFKNKQFIKKLFLDNNEIDYFNSKKFFEKNRKPKQLINSNIFLEKFIFSNKKLSENLLKKIIDESIKNNNVILCNYLLLNKCNSEMDFIDFFDNIIKYSNLKILKLFFNIISNYKNLNRQVILKIFELKNIDYKIIKLIIKKFGNIFNIIKYKGIPYGYFCNKLKNIFNNLDLYNNKSYVKKNICFYSLKNVKITVNIPKRGFIDKDSLTNLYIENSLCDFINNDKFKPPLILINKN